MACTVEKASNGKINKVLDQSGGVSKLFQKILNVPTLSLDESLNIYKNIFSDKLKETIVDDIEPNLLFQTPNNEIFNSYREALLNTNEGKIQLKINDIVIAEVNSDTNTDVFNGIINHLVKTGGLTGERILDSNGDIIYVTKGDSETAKNFTAELVEAQAIKLLGQSSVKKTSTGDFIFTDNLNKITINGEQFNRQEIDDLNYDQLIKKFGKETALRLELNREWVKSLQPTKTKKRLEDITELKTEDELITAIKSLLNKMGVKITSIEDYIKNNKLKNNDVNPNANALMDVVNKIIAFKNGTVKREDLIEETMHLIEATLDPTLTEGVRRNIDKTAEWRQYSENYRKIYAKEYSGEKLEEMVRREILGKVMTNAVINNFALSEDATLAEKSIFDKIREFLQQFFDKINTFFKPEYQNQIDSLNNDIYAKLMAGTLSNELTDQNYGTKFRLYSISNDITNGIVRLQKEAEKALELLRINASQISKEDPSQSSMLKSAKDLLKRTSEATNEVEARIESIATFAKVVNMVQKQTKYLERAVKKADVNKQPFSSEEMIVYRNLIDQFQTNILPVVKDVINKNGKLTKAEQRLVQEIDKAQEDISNLTGKAKNNGFNAKDYVFDLLIQRTGVDAKTEEYLRTKINGLQNETNFFFYQFGNLAHASNPFLNALGSVITKTDYDKNAGFQEDSKPFIAKLAKSGFLKGKALSEFVKGNFLQSSWNFDAITKAENEKKYELYFEVLNGKPSEIKQIRKGEAGYDKAVEDFSKVQFVKDLTADEAIAYAKKLDIWKIENYRLSPLTSEAMVEKRNKLKDYSQVTQEYEANASIRYSTIMQNAEVRDGIPLITQDMKYDIEDLRKLRAYDKSIWDTDGDLRKGIEIVSEEANGAIQIGKDFFVTLDKSKADSDAILSVELSQIDFKKIEEFKNNSGITDSFREMLSKLKSQEAYDFLMLNSYVGYTKEYYDSFDRPSLVNKLEEAKTEDNEEEIDELIEKIVATSKKMNSVLRANKMMNNPSEVNFDRMDVSETLNIKEYSQTLENYYSIARKYLSREQQEEAETISETKVNQAFVDYILDTHGVTFEEEFDTTDEDTKIDVEKLFSEILNHTTEAKKTEILDLKSEIKRFAQGTINRLSKPQKKVFKLTENEYNEMSEEERFSYMTNELLRYSYTKLLPYFRKTQPIGADIALQDLQAGLITANEFLNNYEAGEYQYLSITPNYNFQEATENNNKSQHFQNALLNNFPFYRIFETSTTLEDVKTKSVDQLKAEGKINQFVETDFLKEYDIDLIELFTTGKEVARKNVDKFEARQALLDLQKISLNKLGVLGKHNLFQLPQKEASKTRKFDEFLKSGKGVNSIFDEWFNFREDESELGQEEGEFKIIKTAGNNSIPKFGLRELKKAPVTTDLLESYTWMNYKANEYKARVENIGDAMAIQEALMGSEFEGSIDVKASQSYKMFKNFIDFNFFGIKESWSKMARIPGTNIKFDWAKVLSSFGQAIRMRNLGYTLISPITSATTGSLFYRVGRLVGDIVDQDSAKIADKVFLKHAGEASREILNLESKSMLNALGERFGWYNPMERYDNTMYSKALRGLYASPFAAHQLANFPVNTRVGLAVLANNRFVEGRMVEYKTFKEDYKGKSDKEIRALWAEKTSVLDVAVLEKDGNITFDYQKVADSLNNNFTAEEAKKFLDDKLATVVKGRIKSAIQQIDGQISDEDKSVSTRNAFTSFVNIHRSWLMIAVQTRFKGKHFNSSTGYLEEGIYVSPFNKFLSFIQDAKRTGMINALQNIGENFKNYDDVTKKNIKRTLWELGLLQALVGLTILAMRELGDDDEDSYLFKVSSLFLFRSTNEVASSTVALHKNVYETLENVVVGLNVIEVATDFPDIFSSEEVKRGRYRGLTERERYFYKNTPIIRDYNNLFLDVEGSIKSYNYFNFSKDKHLDFLTLYPFLKEQK